MWNYIQEVINANPLSRSFLADAPVAKWDEINKRCGKKISSLGGLTPAKQRGYDRRETINFELVMILLKLIALHHRYYGVLSEWLITTTCCEEQKCRVTETLQRRRDIRWQKQYLYPVYLKTTSHWSHRIKVETFLIKALREKCTPPDKRHLSTDSTGVLVKPVNCEWMVDDDGLTPRNDEADNDELKVNLWKIRSDKADKTTFTSVGDVRERIELAGKEAILGEILIAINKYGMDPIMASHDANSGLDVLVDDHNSTNVCLRAYQR